VEKKKKANIKGKGKRKKSESEEEDFLSAESEAEEEEEDEDEEFSLDSEYEEDGSRGGDYLNYDKIKKMLLKHNNFQDITKNTFKRDTMKEGDGAGAMNPLSQGSLNTLAQLGPY